MEILLQHVASLNGDAYGARRKKILFSKTCRCFKSVFKILSLEYVWKLTAVYKNYSSAFMSQYFRGLALSIDMIW